MKGSTRARGLVRAMALTVMVAVVAVGCSSDRDDAGSSSSDTTAGPVMVEELRVAYDLAGPRRGAFSWDPSKAASVVADVGLWHWAYGGLMRPDADGTLVPDLAESVNLVDDQTIEVTMRPEVVLQDGMAVDAALVKASLDANLAQNGVARGFSADFFKLSSVDVVDESTVRLTIPDGTAAGWLDSFIASHETVIVPPGTDFAKPMGAGPYTVTAYTPEQSAVLEKNPDYWDADSIHVERIELVNASDAVATVNALNAGQVDWAPRLEVASIPAVGSEFTVSAVPSDNFLVSLAICKSTPPFDDVRVRKAISLAIDRDAIDGAVFEGDADPTAGVFPDDSPYHDPELTTDGAYDPDQARALLAEAGLADGFTFDLAQQVAGNAQEVAQIVQQQLDEVGVTMNLVPTQNYAVEFLTNKNAPVGISPNLPGRPLEKLRAWSGTVINNTCQYSDPELDGLAAQLASTPVDSDDAQQLVQQFERKVADENLSVFIAFRPNIVAYDADKIGGDLPVAYYNIQVPDIRAL
jgi:peptide/nickel transport system substrate-binding protein